MSNTTEHTPQEGTIHAVYGGDAEEATCAKCGQTIIEWNFVDYDDDRTWRIFEPWAIEVRVPTSPNTWRTQKVTTCVG